MTQVNATLTDPGWVDTHTATVTWGDGATSTAPVATAGAGWGSFFGSHVYARPGDYRVTVTLTDDDGGSATVSIPAMTVAAPIALWANTSVPGQGVSWTGGRGQVDGAVHSNSGVSVAGAPKVITGPVTYAGSLSVKGGSTINPSPTQVTTRVMPYQPRIADFRPAGPVAVEVGAAYHDMSAACSGGVWHQPQANLVAGVYYAPCAVQLNGSQIGGDVTIVAEGPIQVNGSRPAFTPHLDGLLFFSSSSADDAIRISASGSRFLGTVYAGAGQVNVTGADNRFSCGIYGDRISLTGNGFTVHGASCERAPSAAGPVIVPELSTAVSAATPTALPGQGVDVDVQVTNGQARVIVPALVGLENVDTSPATVSGWSYVVERQEAGTGRWVPLASLTDPALAVNVSPNAFTGVTYPGTGDRVTGTTITPSGWATWGSQGSLTLTPAQTVQVMDPAATTGLRTRVDFTLTPSGVQARRLFTYGRNIIDQVRAASADATDVTAYVVTPDGAGETVTSATEAALTRLRPGDSVVLHRQFTMPAVAPRTAGESDAAYLARLQAADQTRMTTAAFALASAGVGRLVAPMAQAAATRVVPIVKVSTTGAGVVPAGTSSDYTVTLTGVGSQPATQVTTTATAAGLTTPATAMVVSGAPTTVAPTQVATATTTYAAPAGSAGLATVRAAVTWQDSRGTAYGPVGSDVPVTVSTPPAVQALLTATRSNDIGGDGQVSPGDSIRYTLLVRNTGGMPLTAGHAGVDLDLNTTVVPDSVQTPVGGAVLVTDRPGRGQLVDVTLPDIAAGSSAVVYFDAVVVDPFPTGASSVSAAGTISGSGVAQVATDDPGKPGAADPTVTAVVPAVPALAATVSVTLVRDHNGDGVISAGDTIAVTVDVSATGSRTLTDTHVSLPLPAGTTLVAGTLTATAGNVALTPGAAGAADRIDASLGTLTPLQHAVVTAHLLAADPPPAGVTSLTFAGTAGSAQTPDQPLDNPLSAAIGDPLVVALGSAAGAAGPQVTAFAPADGSIVTVPTRVTATLGASAGESVAGWTLTLRGTDEPSARTLGSGSGTVVDAPLDPSVLPNGLYAVTLTASSSTGAVSTREIAIVVSGQAKLGEYSTTVTDLSVAVAGVPLRVDRSYSSLDKRVGDFGVGWRLGLSSVKIVTNGPLGRGGWSMQGCGGGLVFSPLCFSANRPHLATVIWPDGRTEIFDLAPAAGSTFFPGLTTAKFTGRPGTHSALSAVSADLFLMGDTLVDGLGGQQVYDPKDFVLTDQVGTAYHVTVGVGLTKVVDRAGNTTTFTPNGVVSSRGPQLTFTRDSAGRVTRVTGPDGAHVDYRYDTASDLVSVTDPRGGATTLTYLPGHYLQDVTGPGQSLMARYEYTDGRLTAIIDPLGNRTQISADPGARTEAVASPDGRSLSVSSFDNDGHLAWVDDTYDGRSHRTTFGYDAAGRVTSRTDPLGRTWRATYTDHGFVTSLIGPSGAVTAVTYGDYGQPLTWTDAEGAVTRYAWNPNGTVASMTDATGRTETFTYDATGSMLSRTDALGHARSWTYTNGGLVASETDPTGGVTAYGYDAAGRVTTVTDPVGARTVTAYDAAGQRVSVTDPAGAVSRWEYDALGRVTRRVDPAGAVTDSTYDAAGQLVRVDNHIEAPITHTYDPAGRVITTQVGGLPPTRTDYDPAGRPVWISDPVGRVTTTTYDLAGQVLSTTNPAGGTTRYVYNGAGLVAQTTNPVGLTTEYGYDRMGRTITVTTALGTTTTGYDEAGRVTSTRHADGSTTAVGYDAAGRQVNVTDQAGSVTTFELDAAGRRTATIDAEGRRSTLGYDTAGRVVTATDAAGTTRSSYTPAGWLQSTTSPSGAVTRYGYDVNGRQVSVTDPLGLVTRTEYDVLGRVTATRSPRHGTGAASAAYTYDQYGQVSAETDAAGNRVSFGHDAAGQQVSVTDPLGLVWRVGYDALGGLASATDPLGRTRTVTSDAAGRVVSATDARGVQIGYDYDTRGLLSRMRRVGGPESVSYGYDVLGRRTSMTDATGTTTWGYTSTGLVASVSAPSGTVGYGYDRSGLRTSMTQPLGTVGYRYDQAGRLTHLTDWAGGRYQVGYTADGDVVSITRPNGVTTTRTVDGAGRLTGITDRGPGGSTVSSIVYGLDGDGNRTSATTAAGVESYSFDTIGQLTAVVYPDGSRAAYTYDAAGNRTSVTTSSAGGPARTSAVTYDAASQVSSVGGVAVTSDAAGNVTSGADGRRFEWDWQGHLAGVSGPGGEIARFGVDADGVRTTVTTAGAGPVGLVTDRQATPAGQLIQAAGAGYVYGPTGALAASGGGGGQVHTDALGSVRAVTDPTGQVVSTSDYDVFGAARSTSGSSVGLGFTGAPTTAGLIHLNARDLDPDTGRFLSTDPARPGAPGPTGWNPYTYTANNPTTHTDPTGQTVAVDSAVVLRLPSRIALTSGAQLGAAVASEVTLAGLLLSIAVNTCAWNGTCPTPRPTGPVGGGSAGGGTAGALALDEFALGYGQLAKTLGGAAVTSASFAIAARACVALAQTTSYGTDICDAKKNVPIIFYGNNLPEHRDHIGRVLWGGAPQWMMLTYMNPGHPRGWLRSQPECKTAHAKGQYCDEYPFASTAEGGALSSIPSWRARGIPRLEGTSPAESSLQGGIQNGFYTGCKVRSGRKFLVVPLPSGVPVPSFAVCP